MDLVKFWTVCSSNGIILDAEMRDNIERYQGELKYWNQKINLISRKDEDNILSHHILHSLTILKYVNPKTKARVLDIGTGGGLPGLPIKIARPDLFMYLVDSIKKKAKTTEMFASHTGLKNIWVKGDRVEDLEFDFKFDLIIARAVAPTLDLFNWSSHLIKEEGKFAFLKGGDLRDEIKDFTKYTDNYKVKEIEIDILGFDYFKEEDKKLIILEKI